MGLLHLGYKTLHFTVAEPAAGTARETFVLHHGLGSSQNYWGGVVPALVAAGCRVVAFDATGAGRSSYTQVEQSVESLAADVIGVMDHLGVEKGVVVGHSMGGIVAAYLAATGSDRIVATVLIGPVYPSAAVAAVFEKRIATVERQGMEAMADSIPAGAVGTRASALVKGFIRELLLGQDRWGYISNCRVIAGAKPPAYEDVQVPVLILAGDEDRSAPLEGCERMLAELGTTEKSLEVLRGVGHWHALEAPDEVAAKILEFYQQIQ